MFRKKRIDIRRDLDWNAKLVDSNGSDISRCRLVNISQSGAKLLIEPAVDLPKQFVLMLSEDGAVRRNCELVWRADDAIGVRYFKIPPPKKRAV